MADCMAHSVLIAGMGSDDPAHTDWMFMTLRETLILIGLKRQIVSQSTFIKSGSTPRT